MRTNSMVLTPSPESGSTVCPYRPQDEAGVRELADADRLPGQSRCTPQKPAAARRGPVTMAGWDVPARPRISVLADAENRPHGIIAYLSWTDVRTGVICWVHAHEDPSALRALLGHALTALAPCPQIEAFVCAPPSPLGPGGLPSRPSLVTGMTGAPCGRFRSWLSGMRVQQVRAAVLPAASERARWSRSATRGSPTEQPRAGRYGCEAGLR
ncbi:hypothetical protein [Streptomyces canus]|uniref:hypothetical protein n=1 Tax=Streptomyces canus TaxID=58343 RepID=UPI003812DDAF